MGFIIDYEKAGFTPIEQKEDIQQLTSFEDEDDELVSVQFAVLKI